MTTLQEYSAREDHIIVGVIDEDSNLIGFTVADMHMNRVCSEKFTTASEAMNWADDYYKMLF